MKKLICNICNWSFILFTIVLLSTSCEKDDDMQENPDSPNNPQVQVVDFNKVTTSLIFDNMNVVNGTPPGFKNNTKGTIDLKIDSDTIFWTPGIIKRIKIQKPEGVSLKHGAWVYVPGADSYIETTLREEEESDEVSILYFEFDPTGWELPITFPIEITPLDENGNPADTFKGPACIEKPRGASGSCDIDVQNDFWEWVYYKQQNPSFFTGSWFPHIEESTTNGCCINNESEPDITCTNTNEHRVLDYEIVFMRKVLFMYFINNSKVNVFGQLYSKNLDPYASNFCSNSAGYSENNLEVIKIADYTINADCSISLDNITYAASNPSFLVDPTLYVGGGPSIKYTLISDHYMEQTITGGGSDGGGSGKIIGSIFERRSELDPTGNNTIWFD